MSDNCDGYYDGGLPVDLYDAWYEATLPHGPVAGDVDFYVARAREQGPRVLELAVGTGRVAIPLAQAGFAVTGVDRSPAMLARARINVAAHGLGERIKLIEASMEDFSSDEEFDLAIIAFRSFQHVTTPQAQRRTLANIRTGLRAGGLLVLDMFDADLTTVVPGAKSPAPPREIVDPRTGVRLRRETVSRQCDPVAQTFREVLRYQMLDADDAVVRTQDAQFDMRWATYNEMSCMLELEGYRVEACYGDFKGAPHGYKTEQIWLARNPSH